MDRLMNMRASVQIVNSGTFTGAAKRLKVSPAAITCYINSPEVRLGVQLLSRTTRVGPSTSAALRLLAEVDEAESIVSALHVTPRGTLRLNTSVALALVAPLLPGTSNAIRIRSDHDGSHGRSGGRTNRSGASRGAAARFEFGRTTDRLGRPVLCGPPAYLAEQAFPADRLIWTSTIAFCCSLPRPIAGWRFTGVNGDHEITATGNFRTNASKRYAWQHSLDTPLHCCPR
jgi:DNA-binding transcriptional LysR family regulator